MEKVKMFFNKLIGGIAFKKKAIMIGLIVGLVIILSGFKWETDRAATKAVSEVAKNELEKAVSIEGKYWKIDDSIYDSIEKALKEQGIDVRALGGGKIDYLQKIVKAELVSNYPNLGEEVDINDKNKFQGIINFIRRDAEGTTDGELMQYMEEEEFNKHIANGDYDGIKNMFTIDFGSSFISGNTGADASGTYKGVPINYYADFAAIEETPEQLGLNVSKTYQNARTTTYGPDAFANSGYEGKTCVPGIDLLEGMKIAAKPINASAQNYKDVDVGDWIYVDGYGYFLVSDVGDGPRKIRKSRLV